MQQAWFAGVHSNIGGGYRDSGLSDVSFSWMADKARECGLAIDDAYISQNIHPDFLACLRNSRVGLYRFLPPRDRVIGREPDRRESLDSSALERHQRATNPGMRRTC
jgi:hypothetical protein